MRSLSPQRFDFPVALTFPVGTGLFVRDIGAVADSEFAVVGCLYRSGCRDSEVPVLTSSERETPVSQTQALAHVLVRSPSLDPLPRDSGPLTVELDVLCLPEGSKLSCATARADWHDTRIAFYIGHV